MSPDHEVHVVGAKRQHLTLLFIDLSGSSHIAESLEAEQFAEILSTLRTTSRESIERFGGCVVRMQGDGVLAVFGHPIPTDKDCLHAAQAALEIHSGFDEAYGGKLPMSLRPLQLHSGLHGGLILISQGDVERGRFELVGDAANTAARLAQLAPPGVLLADLDSLGPHAQHFQLDNVTEIEMPGRTKFVRAAHLIKHNGPRRMLESSTQRDLTPFFGRAELLNLLTARLTDTTSAADSRQIFLLGPSGIGKSRLLDEIARLPQTSMWACLRGSCADESRSQVLQPFVEMVRAQQRPIPEGPVGLADGLLSAISRTTGGGPLLLLIDDWQWADDASRKLLERILVSVPVLLVVLASRPLHDIPELGGNGIHFEIAPLDESDAARLVRYWLPRADPFTIGEIYRHAGGVPLYVEELAHSVASQQPLHPTQQRYSTSSWLVALVTSRLARLPADQQEVVRTAAVLGNSFPIWLLLEVGGWRNVDLDLNTLAQADFLFSLESQSSLRFKHGLTRAAVYDTVGLQERRAIHRRGTRALALSATGAPSMEVLEGLAYHSRAASLWDEAADYAELAADQAAAAFAMDVARRHYMGALDSLEARGLSETSVGDRAGLERWCRVVHKLGMTCIFDPLALPNALPLFERCVARAQITQDASLVARSLYWLGYLCYGQGQPRRAERYCREALAIAGNLNEVRLTAQLEATLGQVLAASSAYDEALPLMERALVLKQQGSRRSAALAIGSAFTLACKASVKADRGDFDAAHALLAEASLLVGDTAHPIANSVRNWAMIILLWQGRWQDAIEVAGQSVRLAHSTQALLPLAISRASEGYARWLGLRSPEGLDQIVQAVNWMEQRRGKFFSSIYYGWLVEGFVAEGKMVVARSHAAALIGRARAGDLLGLAVGYRALALAELEAGNLRRIERYLERASHCAMQRGSRREAALNELCKARVLHRLNKGSEAAVHARHAHTEFAAMNMHWHAHSATGFC